MSGRRALALHYGFITWLPTFFVGQGETIARSTGFALLMAIGGPLGSALGAMSADPHGDFFPLGKARQLGGKVVQAWAIEGDWDPALIRSNTSETEWPPRSGRRRTFPEIAARLGLVSPMHDGGS